MFQNLSRMMGAADRLKLRCDECGHARSLSRAQAIARFGADAAPYDIRRRARCRRCGSGQVTVWI